MYTHKVKVTDRYGEVVEKEVPHITKLITHGVIAFIALIFIFGSFGYIETGDMGVKTRLGQVVGTEDAGPYIKLPIIEKMNIVDVRVKTVDYDKNGVEGDMKDTSALAASSKDSQVVWANIVVNYSVNPQSVIDIYSKYRNAERFGFNVIEPIIRETVKSITADYTAEELRTRLTEISDRVYKALNDKLPQTGVILTQSNLTNFDFSPAFNTAIEAKVTAVVNAETAKNKLEEIKYLGQQKIVTAEADAKAARLISDAANNEKYISLKALEVQKLAIEKWNGALPTQFIPGSSLPFINVK